VSGLSTNGSPLTVLLSSAGRRVGLGRAFRESGHALGVALRLVACDMDPEASAACRLADRRYRVPPAQDPAFKASVLDIVGHEGVALIIPTIDVELTTYADARDEFTATGAWINVGDSRSVAVCRDKAETALVLGGRGVAVPKTLDLETARDRWGPTAAFDSVVKPTSGSASRSIAHVPAGAPLPLLGGEPMVVQEQLVGPEYTVNVFVDRHGSLVSAVPHRRVAVRAGEIEKGTTVRDSRLTDVARAVISALPGLRGAFCFQVIDDLRRGPVVFEVNARFGGGYPLAHAAGAHFTRWLLEERLGIASTGHDDWQAGLTMLRFDDAVFIPPEGKS
jgi:carbamoyl-phosphate synthase large subunit